MSLGYEQEFDKSFLRNDADRQQRQIKSLFEHMQKFLTVACLQPCKSATVNAFTFVIAVALALILVACAVVSFMRYRTSNLLSDLVSGIWFLEGAVFIVIFRVINRKPQFTFDANVIDDLFPGRDHPLYQKVLARCSRIRITVLISVILAYTFLILNIVIPTVAATITAESDDGTSIQLLPMPLFFLALYGCTFVQPFQAAWIVSFAKIVQTVMHTLKKEIESENIGLSTDDALEYFGKIQRHVEQVNRVFRLYFLFMTFSGHFLIAVLLAGQILFDAPWGNIGWMMSLFWWFGSAFVFIFSTSFHASSVHSMNRRISKALLRSSRAEFGRRSMDAQKIGIFVQRVDAVDPMGFTVGPSQLFITSSMMAKIAVLMVTYFIAIWELQRSGNYNFSSKN
eukprot:ANDGO_03518.mRNA.1 hypothetical protein